MTIYRNKFFAASNSCRGFQSYYDKVFGHEAIDYLYIIKGGSGTGKSRLMYELANAAEEKGETVEYIYCSSDPKSLDGIIMRERRIAVTDGTPPHTVEPKMPGCREEIINLGRFLNSNMLKDKRDTIEKLILEKEKMYKTVYSVLETAGKADSSCDELVYDSVRREKLKAWAKRFVKRFKENDVCEQTVRLQKSISYMGQIGFECHDCADEAYFITPKSNAEYIVMNEIYEAAKEKGIRMRVSYSPLIPDKIDSLLFTDESVLISILDCDPEICKSAMIINAERFIIKDAYKNVRKNAKLLLRTKEILVNMAVDIMKYIFECHQKIEDIYSSAMDFEKKEKYTAELIERILND